MDDVRVQIIIQVLICFQINKSDITRQLKRPILSHNQGFTKKYSPSRVNFQSCESLSNCLHVSWIRIPRTVRSGDRPARTGSIFFKFLLVLVRSEILKVFSDQDQDSWCGPRLSIFCPVTGFQSRPRSKFQLSFQNSLLQEKCYQEMRKLDRFYSEFK